MSIEALRKLVRNRKTLIGFILLFFLIAFVVVGPWVSSHSPLQPDFESGHNPFGTPAPPSRTHWFGTDTIFRDVFTRLAVGGRLSLKVGVFATAIAMVLGTSIGIITGYFKEIRISIDRKTNRGIRINLDNIVMRIIDVLLSFPFLLLLMAIRAALDRTTELTVFLVLGLTAWPSIARVIRSKTLQIRELEFVLAAQALGQSTLKILIKHIVPNVVSVAIVLATNFVGSMIVAEAALSFLGLSVAPPAPSWGRMLDEGRPYVSIAPWLLIAPGGAIVLTVVGFNILGEGLRDALDPKENSYN